MSAPPNLIDKLIKSDFSGETDNSDHRDSDDHHRDSHDHHRDSHDHHRDSHDCHHHHRKRWDRDEKHCDKDDRYAYAQLASDKTQRPFACQEPTAVLFNLTNAIKNVYNDGNNVRIKHSGTYSVAASAQVGRLRAACKTCDAGYIDFWFKINDRDVPNSNVRISLLSKQQTDVLVNQKVLHLKERDKLSLHMSVEDPALGLGIEATQPLGEPLIPSASLSLFKLW